MNFLSPYRRLIARVIGESPPITSDIDAWININHPDGRLGEIGLLQNTSRAVPTNRGVIPAKFSDNKEYTTYERAVVRLANVTLTGSEGFLRLADGSFVLQTAWYPQQVILHPNYYKRTPRPVVQKTGTYFSLLLYWSTQYYHWLTEDLPLLHGIGNFLPPSVQYLIPGPPSKFHRQSMDLLGIKPDQWIAYDGKENWELENLIFAPPATTSFSHLSSHEIHSARYVLHHPTHFNGPFNHSPDAIRWLSKTLVDAACAASQKLVSTPTRIYITRERANCRRIVNEAELVPLLTELGITVYHLETLSLAEQVQLFHGAELVVGPHGAGLSNIMFCKPGTRVVEVFEPSVIRLCYWSLSSIMELPYAYFFGVARPVSQLDPDIHVDVAQLAKLLREIIG